MSITSDMETIRGNFEQAQIALKYQRVFRDIYQRLKNLDAEIDAITQTTKFDAIPATIKQPLNQYWQFVTAFNAAIEGNTDILELLELLTVEP